MRSPTKMTALLCILLSGSPALSAAETGDLSAFDRLPGGCWRLGDSCQEFEFGLDRRRLVARTVIHTPAGERVVSEGAWFYHPGEEQVIGYFIARDMGVEFFEYRTLFHGDVMLSEVTAWDGSGKPRPYRERWTFTGPDSYTWELFEDSAGSMKRVMQGIFVRETGSNTGR